jgi:hypothetical protein
LSGGGYSGVVGVGVGGGGVVGGPLIPPAWPAAVIVTETRSLAGSPPAVVRNSSLTAAGGREELVGELLRRLRERVVARPERDRHRHVHDTLVG